MWSTIITVVLKLVEYWLGKVGADSAAKLAFYDFVKQTDRYVGSSVKLRSSYEDQLEALKKKASEGGQ